MFTLRFALALVLLAFEFEFPLRTATSQNPNAPIARSVSVPKIVSTTVLNVCDFGGGWFERTTRACGGGCSVGITNRAGASSLGRKTGSSGRYSGAGGFNSPDSSISGGRIGTSPFFLMIVTSPGSSSIDKFSLGISTNFGSSSTSGVPSFIQKRRISSS